MKWFIIVLFMLDPGEPATADRSVYVFTDPTYESQDYCEASITDPQYYPILVEKLLQEYKYPKKIQSVFCVVENQLKQLIGALTAKQV